jgi:acid phosphatase
MECRTMLPMRNLSLVLAVVLLAACVQNPRRDVESVVAPPAHENLNATLWMQSAAEYEAAVRGTFAQAQAQLDAALADSSWSALPLEERRQGFESKPPAIIVDADETMIDNSPFQARGIRDGEEYRYENWLAWVNERRARALPGALEFAQYASSKNVPIYFVTNRDAPAETESTISNLRSLGFPVAADGSNVMLRGDARATDREKSGRRRWIGERHRVLLLLGDNLGDFVDLHGADRAQRDALVQTYASWWGQRWLMQPNPSYGSWEREVLQHCIEALRSKPNDCRQSALRYD